MKIHEVPNYLPSTRDGEWSVTPFLNIDWRGPGNLHTHPDGRAYVSRNGKICSADFGAKADLEPTA